MKEGYPQILESKYEGAADAIINSEMLRRIFGLMGVIPNKDSHFTSKHPWRVRIEDCCCNDNGVPHYVLDCGWGDEGRPPTNGGIKVPYVDYVSEASGKKASRIGIRSGFFSVSIRPESSLNVETISDEQLLDVICEHYKEALRHALPNYCTLFGWAEKMQNP